MPRTSKAARNDVTAVVGRALTSLRPIVTMWRDGLTIIPLESQSAAAPDPGYLTFDQAQAAGGITVEEASARSVPTISAKTGAVPVLLLDGDTVVGGAQNRVINLSILLQATATTEIPVSCLERGRWNNGRRFVSARKVDYGVRRMVASQVTQRALESQPMARHRFAADQGAIWHEIDAKQRRAARRSATSALHDVYVGEADSLAAMARAFPVPRGARGVAVGLYDRLMGLDLFDSAETLEGQWGRLVESAVLAWIDHSRAISAGAAPRPRHRHTDSEALDRMLGRASGALASATVGPSVGLGHDVRFSDPNLVGTALVHDDRAIHVALFRR